MMDEPNVQPQPRCNEEEDADDVTTASTLSPPQRQSSSSSGPASSSSSSRTTTTTTTTAQKTAAIVNANARAVTPAACALAEAVFDAVYVTRTDEEARRAVAEIAGRMDDYRLVVPMGGDGTLARLAGELAAALVVAAAETNETATTTTTIDGNRDPIRTVGDALRAMPPLGYIPLGTGNAVGSVLGQPPLPSQATTTPSSWRQGLRRALRLPRQRRMERLRAWMEELQNWNCQNATTSIVDGEPRYDVVELSMIQIETNHADEDECPSNNIQTSSLSFQNATTPKVLCFFAGVGFDSLMLDDFKTVKRWSAKRNFLPGLLGSVAGYCVALVVRTLPSCVTRAAHEIHVTVRTSDPQASWVDHRRGDLGRRAVPTTTTTNGDGGSPPSTATPLHLLYNGTAGICAAATVPYYGGGLRLFPFVAGPPGTAHLRIGRIHPLRGAAHIPGIFAGTYRDRRPDAFGCLDFVARDFWIDVRAANPPFPARRQDQSHDEQQDDKGNNGDDSSGNNSNNNNYKAAHASNGFPLQHSGESIGSVRHFRLQVTSAPVRLVSPLPPRPTQG